MRARLASSNDLADLENRLSISAEGHGVADQEATWRVHDDLVGKSLGGCVITDLLGQGGMARVYLARQKHLDRDVAIKVLPPYYASDQNFVDRFELERQQVRRRSLEAVRRITKGQQLL